MAILREISPGKLKVAGTATWITRYGLFLTAAHVIRDLAAGPSSLGVGYIPQLADDEAVYLRRIRSASVLDQFDLAVGQAENHSGESTKPALPNLRAHLSLQPPPVGSELVTFAYPENHILDFTDGSVPEIRGDYYEGRMLAHVAAGERPFIPHPHFETTLEVLSGASGGGVFFRGKVVGINCRGWDFRGGEQAAEPLSSIIPVLPLLQLTVENLQVPPDSWEAQQMPRGWINRGVPIGELVARGHILCA